MADHFALLTGYLADTFEVPVYRELPPKFEDRGLPAIQLLTVGPADPRPGLNTLGVDFEDIDLHFFATRQMMLTGEAFRLAQFVRVQLSGLHLDEARVLDVTRPEQILDYNPRIRRLGMTITVASPAADIS